MVSRLVTAALVRSLAHCCSCWIKICTPATGSLRSRTNSQFTIQNSQVTTQNSEEQRARQSGDVERRTHGALTMEDGIRLGGGVRLAGEGRTGAADRRL